MKGCWIVYSAAELAWIEQRKDWVISHLHRAFCEAFDRADVSLPNLHALRKRRGWKTGRTGHFEAGQAPVNKGKPCEPGRGGRHPNARKTQFRAGSMSGRARERYKPIGTERISEDGYLERKVHDGLPLQSRWQLVQRIEWEAANGPIPDGYALKCLSGDKLNTAPSNWEAIPRGVLARLNGGRFKRRLAFDEAHPDVKPAVMAMAKLEHAAHLRGKARA
jgi:hypothetical protein